MTKVMPIDFSNYSLSHSLVMAVAWAVLFGIISLIVTKNEKVSLVLAGLVASNWFLNVIFHRSDMFLLPAPEAMGVRWGLGLWNSLTGTIVVELLLFAAGIWLYLKSTQATDGMGQWGLWIPCWLLVIVLMGAAIFTGMGKMPLPKNEGLVAIAGLIQLLFVAWGFWLDDHRKAA
jgi:hypothetical protein